MKKEQINECLPICAECYKQILPGQPMIPKFISFKPSLWIHSMCLFFEGS